MNPPLKGGQPATLLVLHTSDADGVVGVCQGESAVAEGLDSGGRHASSVLGAVERVLHGAALSMDAVDGMVVTLGPGSFTGIRIGLATAQGLAAARDWFVWACDSLIAQAAAAQPGPISVVQDARRGEVYAALYDVDSDGRRVPRQLVAPFCDEPGAAGTRLLAASPSGSCAAFGSGASLVANVLERPAVFRVQERPSGIALVEALVSLAREGGCRRLEAHQLEPTYLRRPDAEIQRELNS